MADGSPLRNDRDALDVIAAAAEHRPEVIVIPIGRFDEDFFRLRTGIAGQVIQKFVTYRLRLVIMGDISNHLQQKFRAQGNFVYECNRGSNVWFVAYIEELNHRMQPRA